MLPHKIMIKQDDWLNKVIKPARVSGLDRTYLSAVLNSAKNFYI
jgi:hypothetical protein